MASKHLSYEERLKIQEGLSQNKAIFAIAKSIKRTNTAIRNEITRNRYLVTEKSYTIHTCENRNDCYLMHICGDMECNKYCMGCIRVCNHPECPKYVPAQCEKTTSAPFVCNGCELLGSGKCKYPKYLYNARRAQIVYEDKLKASRQGIALTPEEMSELDNLVSPLLLQGQSIKAVFLNHKDEMPCSERTLYNYVDGCYLTARNLDLPRKVKYKVRYKTNDKRNKQPFTFDRTYADFKKFLMDNPDVNIVEMDTVIGSQGEKILLTLLFRNCSLMIGILLERKTIDAVAEALNNICEAIGIKRFQKLFGVILTDRGTEFSNPYAIESDPNGEIKTRVFYCDPYSSWQKGMIEKNHEFIRYIIPSGKSFDNLSQQDITLMMNHINNYPRANLNGATPYALAKLLIDEKLLEVLNLVAEAQKAADTIITQMQAIAITIPEYNVLRSMNGVGDRLGPLILAEIGDVRRFHSGKALNAYAGNDAPPYQSGNFESHNRHISKRGNAALRKYCFEVMQALKLLKPQNDPVYLFLVKKEQEGKPYNVAKMAGVNKFLRIYYARVMELEK